MCFPTSRVFNCKMCGFQIKVNDTLSKNWAAGVVCNLTLLGSCTLRISLDGDILFDRHRICTIHLAAVLNDLRLYLIMVGICALLN